MKLSIDRDQQVLTIELSNQERLWSFRWNKTLTIPLGHICKVSTETPSITWLELRAPGTFVPGLIKAGTYYNKQGKDFWYATRGKGFLVLELEQDKYRRVVLTIDDNEGWAAQLRAGG